MRNLGIAGTFAAVLMAAPGWAAKEQKYAAIDMQKLLADYQKTGDLSSRFDEEVAGKKKQLADQAGEIERLQADYEKSKAALSDKSRKEKEYIITKKSEDFEKARARMTEELDKKRSDLNDLLMQEIKQEVEKVATAKGYDIVFDKAAFLYTKEGIAPDITALVVESLDKQYKAEKK